MTTLKALLKSLVKVLATFAVVALIVLSIRVTKPDLMKLITSGSKAKDILSQLLSPTSFEKEVNNITVSRVVPVPCGVIPNPEEQLSGPRIIVDLSLIHISEPTRPY
jgi:hypothetical protein